MPSRSIPVLRRAGLVPILLLVSSLLPLADEPAPEHAPGEILIKFRDGAGLTAPQEALALVGGARLRSFRSGAQRWKVAEGLSVEDAIAALQGDPRVEYVEPNYILTASLTPNDPEFPSQWPLRNTGQAGGTPGADVDAERAWDSTTGSRDVLVGIIDTGVDYTHLDLVDNMWTNPGELPGNLVDDDGNGYVDDVQGWDFINHDNDPYDDHGHGTSVAGIIGATGNNGQGVAGLNWSVSIVPLKFLGVTGRGTTAGAIEALEYATAMGVDVTNNSYGGGGFSQAFLDAIRAAGGADSVFVAAAGNAARDTDQSPMYPAGYDAANLLSVAATDAADELASFSNYGAASVDLGAPGLDAWTTAARGGYRSFAGTSCAAPHVAGVVALMRAVRPALPVDVLLSALLDGTDPLPALAGITVTGGRLNAARALAALDEVPPGGVTDLSVSNPTSSAVLLSWTATGDDGAAGTAAAYDVRASTGPLDETTFDAAMRVGGWPHPARSGSPDSMEAAGLQPGTTYHFALKAIDDAGQAGPMSNVVVATTLPPPRLASAPSGFAIALLSGQTATRSLVIGNVGGGTLDWSSSSPGAPWLSAAPPAGRIWAGQQQEVILTVDASGLIGGDHTAALVISSNDPIEPSRSHPVILSVTGAPVMTWSPSSIDAGIVFVGFPATRTLTFANTGTADLVAHLQSGHPDVTVSVADLSLAPGADATLDVTLAPGAPGPISTRIVIDTNASNAAHVEIPVTATALAAPGIAVAPGGFDERLLTGGTVARSLRVGNTGGSDLIVSFEAVLDPPARLVADPGEAVIPAGGFLDVTITIEAGISGTAAFSGSVEVRTNVPDRPTIGIPVSLSVTAAPDIRLGKAGGGTVVLESVKSYTTSGAATTHDFWMSVPPAAGGTLDLMVDGVYFDWGWAIVLLEGTEIAYLGGYHFCEQDHEVYPLSATRLQEVGTDGLVRVVVENTPDVSASCDVNQHTVALSYEGLADVRHLDFGPVFTGSPRALPVILFNAGREPLHIGSISSDNPAFVPDLGPVVIGQGAPVTLTVTFTPPDTSVHEGTITIASDDPDTPALVFTVTGSGSHPPVIGVAPAALAAALPWGGEETQALTISNSGLSVLDFELELPGSAGEFELLGAAPSALTCVVEDPASGTLYAQALRGTAFYRYRPVPGVWEHLAASPLNAGSGGGAALLDGRIYTSSLPEAGRLGVYDIANNSWSTITNPLAAGTGSIAGDGTGLLYLASGLSFASLDPVTGTATGLSPPPFPLTARGGMRHFSGVIYALEGEGRTRFASYDVASGAWTERAPLPAGAVLGLAIDPYARALYAHGAYGGQSLYRFPIDTGIWSVATLPFFKFGDGGLAWLPSPVPSLLVVQGGSGPGLARLVTDRGFLRVSPTAGSVPPSATMDVQVTFDARQRHAGAHAAGLVVHSNDPFRPDVHVPATLDVSGAPRLVLGGPRRIESEIPYATWEAVTAHHLALDAPPVAGGALTLIAEGNYGSGGQTAAVITEGHALGLVGGASMVSCAPASRSFALTTAALAALAADGAVDVTVRNSYAVQATCPVNRHRVRLDYDAVVDRLEFGDVIVGQQRRLALPVANTGTDVLHVSAVSAGSPAFLAPDAAFSVAPGASHVIEVAFVPAGEGIHATVLTLLSDDPANPVVTLPLRGTGAGRPVAAVSPDSLHASLPSGTQETLRLTLSNGGGSPLDFTVEAHEAPQAGQATAGAPGIPGFFDRLASSPSGLSCVVEDPGAGMLYGLGRHNAYPAGQAFFRYRAADDTWEPLGEWPSWTELRGGAALLDGRIYVSSESLYAALAVYDIASETWSTLGIPEDMRTAQIAAGGGYIYLGANLAFRRIEPGTGNVTSLATPPFRLQRNGGMRHLDGVLYVHQGGGLNRFASYDIASGVWTELSPMPAAGLMGAAIDPVQRAYYAYGPEGGDTLFRYSIDEGVWSAATIPFFTVSDGGMGWLPSPVAAIVLTQGVGGTGLARFVTVPGLVRVSPGSGTVPAHGSLDLAVTLDAANRFAGTYASEIRVATSDPVHPLLAVPATLEVMARPDIAVTAEPASVESTLPFTGSGATTSHALPVPLQPSGDALMWVEFTGDLLNGGEYVTIWAEGLPLGRLGPYRLCAPTSGWFPIGAADLAALAADGVVNVEVRNSDGVTTSYCSVHRHAVRLDYTRAWDPLEFGELFIGASRTRTITVANRGPAVLHVGAITSDLPEFTASPPAFDVPPGGSRSVGVTFRPSGLGPVSGTLAIASDDPETPVLALAMTGTSLGPPIIDVSPDSFEVRVVRGDQAARTLTVSNTGTNPLDFTVQPQEAGAGRAGTLEFLADSPQRLSCIVEDPIAGFLYGQAVGGSEFYRYAAGSGSWQRLAGAPVSGGVGGAAQLSGRIYNVYADSPAMQVYDTGSSRWTTMPNPLGAGTANITSDDVRYLYLAAGGSFVRFDPADGSVVSLPAPPFAFEPRGGLRHLSGIVYGHQGNGRTGFAAYDITAQAWTTLPPLPSAGAMGAAIDPIRRSYYVHGLYGSSILMRYAIDAGAWETIPFPLFYAGDVGMGWLPSPDPGVYIPRGQSGTSFARINTGSGYLRATPPSATVPAGGSLEVSLLFDSAWLPAGAYASAIEVASNDPRHPVVTVAASFQVIELPRMVIAGAVASVESSRDYTVTGATTSHLLLPPGLPAGQATIQLLAEGEFWSSQHTASLFAGDTEIGHAGATGLACGPASGAFVIPPESIGSLMTDGVMSVRVSNAPAVGTFCPVNRHTVRLSWPVASDRLDYGTTTALRDATLTLLIANLGPGPLHIASITSTDPAFLPGISTMLIPPGGSAELPIRFRAPAAGVFDGMLRIQSDDPLSPVLSIPLSAAAVEPPAASVEPASVEEALPSGDVRTRDLILSNTGSAPLHFALNTWVPPQAPFLSAAPSQGVVPPGGTASLEVVLNAGLAGVGVHPGEIVVATDDPIRPLISVPFSLHVIGRPSIRLTHGTTAVSSTRSFQPWLGRTTHALDLPEVPGGSGWLELEATGDFNFFARTATAAIEGFEVGTVGGGASPFPLCGPVRGAFPVSGPLLAASAADGVVHVNVMNSLQVTQACDPSAHAVTLTYHHPLAALDFGDAMLGGIVTRSIFVENVGGEVLTVHSIAADSPAIATGAASMTVPPHGTRELLVTFTPLAGGSVTGVLTMLSDDPQHPVVTLPVSGSGSPPPVLDVGPSSLSATLRAPATETAPLIIRNAGVFPLSFSLTIPAPWVSATPSSGVVPAAGSIEVSVTLDASSAAPGPHETTIDIASNDPNAPLARIPVSLYVLGWPSLSLQGEPVTVHQSRAWTTPGALRTIRLLPPMPPAGSGRLDVTVEGEFGAADETATVDVEGVHGFTLGGSGGTCTTAGGTVYFTPEEMSILVTDGVIQVAVQNSSAVGASCPMNRHTVSLTYAPVPDQIEFGAVFTGGRATRTIFMENKGTDVLVVDSMAADTPDFEVQPPTLSLPPSGSRAVTVGFAPSMPGDLFGALVIHSNDPARPELVIGLTGTALPAPVMGVHPLTLTPAIVFGGSGTLSLTITNAGGSDLDFSTAVRTMGPTPFVIVSPLSATVTPGESAALSVRIDTAGLPVGSHAAAIDIASNDPEAPVVTVPVELTVIGIPDIAVSDERLDFGQVFPGHPAGRTLQVENRGSATLHVTAALAGGPGFQVAPTSLSLIPGATAGLTVSLTAASVGPAAGTLVLSSDDPDTPALSVPLAAMAVLPPIAGLDPASIVAALPPGGSATARALRLANTGASDLTWAVGGMGGPEEPLPGWLSVSPSEGALAPGKLIELTVTLAAGGLSSGDHMQPLSLHSNDPVRGRIDAVVLLHVGEVAPEIFLMEPSSLDMLSKGSTMKATVQLGPGLDPHDVVIGSVLLNGVVPPIAQRTSFADENGDGREEIIFKFDRAAVRALLPSGPRVVVTITGEVRDRIWFRGTTTIRVFPRTQQNPNGVAGDAVTQIPRSPS